MEPDVGLAYFDADGRLTIRSKSIGIFLHHTMICPGLGIEPEKLRIFQNPAGGTFGYKFSPTMEALLGVAAMATGKPASVRLSSSSSSTVRTRAARSSPWKATGS
jgi:aldehyde oxidoreductase